jgi:hypothetical protein
VRDGLVAALGPDPPPQVALASYNVGLDLESAGRHEAAGPGAHLKGNPGPTVGRGEKKFTFVRYRVRLQLDLDRLDEVVGFHWVIDPDSDRHCGGLFGEDGKVELRPVLTLEARLSPEVSGAEKHQTRTEEKTST